MIFLQQSDSACQDHHYTVTETSEVLNQNQQWLILHQFWSSIREVFIQSSAIKEFNLIFFFFLLLEYIYLFIYKSYRLLVTLPRYMTAFSTFCSRGKLTHVNNYLYRMVCSVGWDLDRIFQFRCRALVEFSNDQN